MRVQPREWAEIVQETDPSYYETREAGSPMMRFYDGRMFIRYDEDQWVEFKQFIDALNETFEEEQ